MPPSHQPSSRRSRYVDSVGAQPRPTDSFRATQPGVSTSALPEPEIPKRISRFEIRRLIGEGGFGRVYEAYDPSLKRVVALKVARSEHLDDPRLIERFRREAQSAAGLAHQNIVAVFDHGEESGIQYIASAFVPGGTLAALLKQQGGSLPLRQAVTIVRQLAEALAYAHRQGVIHRDVKPANVLMRGDDEPLLADFGLAAIRQGAAEKLTQDGEAIGTCEYMAPEQWRGQAVAACDQYSLGCILYEGLTGQMPFSTRHLAEYASLHLSEPPPSPRTKRPDLPRDLETITLKCLEKDPRHRYSDCQALAEDLRRWLDGEPVSARRPGLSERLVKWTRRNPVIAGLLAAILAILTVGVTGMALLTVLAVDMAREANRQRDRAEQQASLAEERRTWSRRLIYANYLSLALSSWHDQNAFNFHHYLNYCYWDLRGWEHDLLWSRSQSKHLTLQGHRDSVTGVDWSRDGRLIVTASHDSTVKLWDAHTGRLLRTLEVQSVRLACLALSPDGSLLAVGGPKGFLRVWEVASGNVLYTRTAHESDINHLAWSPDGKQLLIGGFAGSLLWDARTGKEVRKVDGHANLVFAVAFSPDG